MKRISILFMLTMSAAALALVTPRTAVDDVGRFLFDGVFGYHCTSMQCHGVPKGWGSLND